MYDVGELSIMIVSLRSRPTCDKSCEILAHFNSDKCEYYLDVVSLMIVTTFSEQTVMNNAVNIQLI